MSELAREENEAVRTIQLFCRSCSQRCLVTSPLVYLLPCIVISSASSKDKAAPAHSLTIRAMIKDSCFEDRTEAEAHHALCGIHPDHRSNGCRTQT